MDETAPTASSALRSKKSSSPSVSEPFLFNSSALEEGGLTLCAGGFQTVMGITSNGCSTVLPKESFAFATEPERGYELEALGISVGDDNTCPGIRTWVEGEEEDAPPISELCPNPDGLSQRSPKFSVSRSRTSETASPLEPEALPWWAWQLKARWERFS